MVQKQAVKIGSAPKLQPVEVRAESQMEKEVSALVAMTGERDSSVGMKIAKAEILKIIDSVPADGKYDEAFEKLALLFKRSEPAAHAALYYKELALNTIPGHGKGILTRLAILNSEFAREAILPLWETAFLTDTNGVSNVAMAVLHSPEIASEMLKNERSRIGQYLECDGAIFKGQDVPRTKGVTIRDEIRVEHPGVWFRYHPVSYSIAHPIKALRLARRPR